MKHHFERTGLCASYMCDCCVYVELKLGKHCVQLSDVCVCIAGLLVSVASNAGVLCYYVPVVILMKVLQLHPRALMRQH